MSLFNPELNELEQYIFSFKSKDAPFEDLDIKYSSPRDLNLYINFQDDTVFFSESNDIEEPGFVKLPDYGIFEKLTSCHIFKVDISSDILIDFNTFLSKIESIVTLSSGLNILSNISASIFVQETFFEENPSSSDVLEEETIPSPLSEVGLFTENSNFLSIRIFESGIVLVINKLGTISTSIQDNFISSLKIICRNVLENIE